MMSGNEYKVIGTRPIRHDGVDKVTGKAKYGGDLTFPDMYMERFCEALTHMPKLFLWTLIEP